MLSYHRQCIVVLCHLCVLVFGETNIAVLLDCSKLSRLSSTTPYLDSVAFLTYLLLHLTTFLNHFNNAL